ncbi:MAG: iron-sulfur cluster assembly protein, partial [Stellaceae bacterium]
MTEVLEKDVLAALKRVADPDRGQDIVTLGMIAGLSIREGHVGFAIEVDRTRGPKLESLRRAAEKAVEALPGVLSVSAVLTAETMQGTPQPARGHEQGHAHGAPQAEKPAVPGVKFIIAVASGKGGVGKS